MNRDTVQGLSPTKEKTYLQEFLSKISFLPAFFRVTLSEQGRFTLVQRASVDQSSSCVHHPCRKKAPRLCLSGKKKKKITVSV